MKLLQKRIRQYSSYTLATFILGGGIAHAQNDATYIDGVVSVGKNDTLKIYGNAEMAPTAQLYIEGGAVVLFYGANFKLDPGAQIYGANSSFSIFNPAAGTGRIVFQQPNPMDGSTVQQTLDGGNNGSATLNTLTALEINNPLGVKLVNSNVRVGSDVLFTTGHLFLDTWDAVLGSDATLTNYDDTRYVVTAASGHLVKENLGTTFTFPVGMATADYTPVSLAPGSLNTLHVNVTDYAGSAPVEAGTDGMDRTWNIFGDNAGGATITLQHNSSTNQSAWNTAANFVTQYGTDPNNTGDAASATPWQSNTPAVSSTAGGAGTESQVRTYAALATTTTANEAWFSKASNVATPLPLYVTSFTALSNNCDAILNWTAGYVEAGASFTVERSSNGSNFAALGTVAANVSQSHYSYADKEALKDGSRYYRLKLNEPDGSSIYTTVQEVKGCEASGAAGFVLAPNPVYSGQSVNLVYSGEETEVWYQITDVPGKVLQRSQKFNIGGASGNTHSISLNGVAKGGYIVTLVSGDGKLIGHCKLIIQ